MKETRLLMGMPITVHIVDAHATQQGLDAVFDYFSYIDETFSPYKENSEVSQINRGEITTEKFSQDMIEIFQLSDKTKHETNGYFNIEHNGKIDPSGLVKGWAIQRASELLKEKGLSNFFIDAGGDIQVSGNNENGKPWRVGIRNPFKREENIKILSIQDKGVATSGTAIRGQHIWNPFHKASNVSSDEIIVSLTIIGPNVYEADRFATAAFAMGKKRHSFYRTTFGI